MGAPNPRPDILELGLSGRPVTLYAKLKELEPFIGVQAPSQVSGEETIDVQVKQHTRRRYPGAVARSVSAHPSRRTIGKRAAGRTLPGNNAYFERKVGSGENAKTVVEQITYTGAFADLKVLMEELAVIDFVLRTPWGEPVKIFKDPQGGGSGGGT